MGGLNGKTMGRLVKSSSAIKPKELALEMRRKLQEAYERGTTSEATKFLVEEFEQLRKAYNEQMKDLRKQIGL